MTKKRTAAKAPAEQPAEPKQPTLKASLLVYDVPAALDVKMLPKKVHPSAVIRRFGAKINLSCWVLPKDNIPWAYLDDLTQAGVDWKVADFNPADADNLLNIVTEALAKEVAEVNKGLEASLAKQTAKLEADHAAAENGDKAEAVRKRFLTAGKVACDRVRRILKDCEQAASGFSIGTGDIAESLKTVAALREGCKAKAFMYAQAAKGLTDPGLKAAAEDGSLPAPVLIDALIDQGDQAGPVGSLAAAFDAA